MGLSLPHEWDDSEKMGGFTALELGVLVSGVLVLDASTTLGSSKKYYRLRESVERWFGDAHSPVWLDELTKTESRELL
jgi:hypothetical protein